jgi:asparagine synthase (glutamine-hydrolysing)
MCGIAAIFSPKGNLNKNDFARMDASLPLQAHRGPDSHGVFSNDFISLGHNRLSIIDLSDSANQPFSRVDLGLKIIFNGEIYNYQEIKKDLLRKGHKFYTDSDTEVILVAFQEYGEKFLERLVGMFAFVIYKEQDNSIFAARDRFGEKPIFYIFEDGVLYLASELRTLISLYPKECQINQEAVVDLIENLYISDSHTIYKEVKKFPKGSYLSFSEEPNFSTYYSLPSDLVQPIPFEQLKRLTKEKLYEIIARELHADVPVASFLSAGIDSSLITAIANDIKPGIQAITMSTHDAQMDESSAAKKFAKLLNINHEIVPVDVDSLQHLSYILKDIEPLADASLIPSYMVTDQIKSRFKVMLSGDGGDELFGSYNRTNVYDSLKFKGIPGGKKIVKSILNNTSPWVEKHLGIRLDDRTRIKLGGWNGYYQKNNLNNSLIEKVFNNQTNKGLAFKKFLEIEEKLGADHQKISFHFDYETRLPGAFLQKIDSASMHSSVEVRAPFLDHTLVDLIMKIPNSSLMPNKIDKELTKSILVDFTKKPMQGPKKGFSIPYSKFMQGEWGDVLLDYINEGKSTSLLDINQEGVKELIFQHQSNPSPTLARVLFALLVLEIWIRVFHLNVYKAKSVYTP